MRCFSSRGSVSLHVDQLRPLTFFRQGACSPCAVISQPPPGSHMICGLLHISSYHIIIIVSILIIVLVSAFISHIGSNSHPCSVPAHV